MSPLTHVFERSGADDSSFCTPPFVSEESLHQRSLHICLFCYLIAQSDELVTFIKSVLNPTIDDNTWEHKDRKKLNYQPSKLPFFKLLEISPSPNSMSFVLVGNPVSTSHPRN